MWAGVRNPLAQKHLRSIKRGDRIFYYHTGKEKAVVATAKATSDAYPDPNDTSGKLSVVDIVPDKKLPRAVTLAEIKSDKAFASFPLVRMSRLSVMPVTDAEWERDRETQSFDFVILRTLVFLLVLLPDRRRPVRKTPARAPAHDDPDFSSARRPSRACPSAASCDWRRTPPAPGRGRFASRASTSRRPIPHASAPCRAKCACTCRICSTSRALLARWPAPSTSPTSTSRWPIPPTRPPSLGMSTRACRASSPGRRARRRAPQGPSACSSAFISPSRSSPSSPRRCFCWR